MRQVVRTFLVKDENILLVKHNETTKWALPWWHIEEWETIFQAIHRELKEEFNFDIEIVWDKNFLSEERVTEYPKPISIYTISYNSLKFWDVTKLEFIFNAKYVSWELKVQTEEIYDYKWFSKEEILDNSNDIYSQIVELLDFV